MSEYKSQRGEIILIILLVMAVGLTIGLAVASRSITDVRLSNQIEESSRAFSAAEAGIEEVLKTGLINYTPPGGSVSVGSGASYNVQLNSYGPSNDIFTFPTEIAEGDTQTIWLVGQKADGSGPDDSVRLYNGGSINLCWEDLVTGTTPALDVSLLFKSGSEYKVVREAFDPVSRSNDFVPAQNGDQCSMAGTNQKYWTLFNFNMDASIPYDNINDTPIAIRVRPVYTKTKIAAKGSDGGIIPEQGKNIVSTGQTNSGVERRWNVVQTYSSPNDIFDYAVWSNKDLTK
ncbi:hypothetical protein HYT02_03450 [Candidatus Gottesmanbacteria bacterium]|nr:hypothetical protein [Candidatus Gottesmanbacteria bacterium]